MHIGVSSYAFRYAARGDQEHTPLAPLDILAQAHELGAEMVQFCENAPLGALGEAELQQLVDAARDYDVAVEVGTRGLAPEPLRAQLKLARRVGSRSLRLVLDESDDRKVREALRALLPDLRESGVGLAIENHASLSSARLAELARELDEEWVGFCVDTANTIALLEWPQETVRNLAPLARQCHLKDFVIEAAPIGLRVTGRPLGKGMLPAQPVLGLLAQEDRDVDYMIELWMDPADTFAETLTKERDWIASSLATAHQWLRQGAKE